MQDFILDDAAYPLVPPSFPIIEPEKSDNWFDLFYDMDKYDWNDPRWKRLNSRRRFGFLPIPLTQGYFMIVLIRHYEQMTVYPDGRPKKWRANVQYDKWGNISGIYAVRTGKHGEPNLVYAHRELLDCLDDLRVVDHIDGYSLDNRADTDRDVNLILCSHRMNGHNTRSKRRVNKGLPRGVEMWGKNEKGEQLYGWMRSYRLSREEFAERVEAANGKPVSPVDYIRSPEAWTSPGKAHQEYEKEIHQVTGGKKSGVHAPHRVNYPIFPPMMDSEPAPSRDRSRARASEDVPF